MAKEQNKSRAWALMLYPQEDASHYSALLKATQLYQYAFIEHNKDIWAEETEEHKIGELKKSHIHLILKFENARHKSKIAKELEIPENYIQKANFVAYTRYLVHKDDKLKHQYEEKEICTNIPKEVNSALSLKGDYSRSDANLIMNEIKSKNIRTFYELAMWAQENGQLKEVMNNAYFYRNLLRG